VFSNSGLGSGKYTLLVRARHVGAITGQESYSTTTLLSGNVCTAVALAASPQSPSPPPVGTITLTPTPTCTGGSAEYLYQVKAPGASSYSDLTSWVSTPGSWNTSGLVPGQYSVRVLARGAGNPTTPFESLKAIPYGLTDTCRPVSALITPPATATIGAVVSFNADAPCAGASTPQFRFSYRLNGAAAFTILQDYGSDDTLDWDTTGLSPGSYQLKVDSRAPGAIASQSYKAYNYTLVAPLCPSGYQSDGAGGCQVIPMFALVGVPSGTTGNQLIAVSGDGNVFGGQLSVSANIQAAVGTLATGLVGIGRLLPSHTTSLVEALSGDGSIAVGQSTGASTEAFRWSEASGMVGLGLLPGPGSNGSVASNVSQDGTVVAGIGSFSPSRYEPFRWTQATGLIGLGTADVTRPSCVVTGMSADGAVIVGWCDTSGTANELPFRWTNGTGMQLLPLPAGGTKGGASDVSANGQVVVGFVTIAGVEQGYRWSQATGPVSIPGPAGATQSSLTAVNADGSIAVGQGTFPSGGQATIWDATRGLRLLSTALSQVGVSVTSGRRASDATGISSDGHTIVGSAANLQGFVWGYIARL
jgi:uncharacterized membrane protein